MCVDVMSAVHARCPDCAARLLMPYTFCPDGGAGLHPVAFTVLLEHARRRPILHPTVLPDRHRTRRPA